MLVPLVTVVTMLDAVDAEDLTLTPAVVLNGAADPLVWNFRKSDLIKPVEPPTVTLDQPAGLWSRTSTLVPLFTSVIEVEAVDGSVLRFTLLVVWNVPADAEAGADILK
jgi:hypothetical protein